MCAFDPEHLTPAASLNRLRIVDLPGVALEPDVRGKTGFDLLAAQSLGAAIRQHADALGDIADLVDPRPASAADLLLALDRCLASADLRAQAEAHRLARHFGRSLGYVLLTLARGDECNRRARADWDGSVWAYWASIRHVWLGGGIVSGRLGPQLVRGASEVLAENSGGDLSVHLSATPGILPLVGAARGAPPLEQWASQHNRQLALVCDFGSTFAKRAYAVYLTTGALAALHLLPPLPAPRLTLRRPDAPTRDEAEQIAGQIADVLARTWHEGAPLAELADGASVALAPVLVASLAAYVRDGSPLPRQGGVYAALHALAEPADRSIARRLSTLVGRPLDVALVHDGTAAARTFAGVERTAVIMLGTALGVGFAPPAQAFRPLAPALAARFAQQIL
jgi:hypothetical protein